MCNSLFKHKLATIMRQLCFACVGNFARIRFVLILLLSFAHYFKCFRTLFMPFAKTTEKKCAAAKSMFEIITLDHCYFCWYPHKSQNEKSNVRKKRHIQHSFFSLVFFFLHIVCVECACSHVAHKISENVYMLDINRSIDYVLS